MESQSAVERQHIIRAFRFELTKVQTVAVRERVVAQLRNVSEELAKNVADGLGMTNLPDPLPSVLKQVPKPEIRTSKELSLLARPGKDGIKTRAIAIILGNGVEGEAALKIRQTLTDQGAVPRFVGMKLGKVTTAAGDKMEIDVSLETAPAVTWDAMVIPDGKKAVDELSQSGHALEFLKDQYRHCKTILLLGDAKRLVEKAGIPQTLPSGKPDPGLLVLAGNDAATAAQAFVAALAKHRHFERETDPPRVQLPYSR